MSIERRPPQLTLAHDVAEKAETVGLFIAVGGALIGDVGRGRGALEQGRALLVVDRADLHDGAGKPQPGGGVVGLRRDDLAEQRHAGAEIVLGKGCIGVFADLRHRLGGGAGVRLDLTFELNRAVGEIAVDERLVCGMGRKRRNGKERGRDCYREPGASERKHR
jgi:hypothetical protein